MIYIDDKVIEEVASGFHIPVKPEILTELQHVMSKRESNIFDEASVIAKDVGLSSAILKTVNSSFFGLRKKISDIHKAACFLGMDILNDLVTALLFKSSFDGIPSCLSLERYWDDASDAANAMIFISKNITTPLPVECLYSIGLFHDCGIPALSNKFDDYKRLLIEANTRGQSSIALEESKYKTNHAIVGYFIASSWNLPSMVCNIVLNHHEMNFLTKSTSIDEKLGYATLKLAENLVERKKRDNTSPDWEELKDSLLKILNLTTDQYSELENDFCTPS